MTAPVHAVVMNAEEQHSIWPLARAVPNGWARTGFSGSRQQCLDHIAAVWTDIRPKSVRQDVDAHRAAHGIRAGRS